MIFWQIKEDGNNNKEETLLVLMPHDCIKLPQKLTQILIRNYSILEYKMQIWIIIGSLSNHVCLKDSILKKQINKTINNHLLISKKYT